MNVYGSDALAPSPNRAATSSNPKPLKTLGQLVTSITSLRFNRDGQILAMASREKKDALRLVTRLSYDNCQPTHLFPRYIRTA